MIARSASMDVREGTASEDTQCVRATEQLDWARLAAYLRDHLPLAGIADLDVSRRMEVEQFPGGHSNLTYLVRFGQAELVLRRPPLGPVPLTAHDMAREHRWLAALHRVFAGDVMSVNFWIRLFSGLSGVTSVTRVSRLNHT